MALRIWLEDRTCLALWQTIQLNLHWLERISHRFLRIIVDDRCETRCLDLFSKSKMRQPQITNLTRITHRLQSLTSFILQLSLWLFKIVAFVLHEHHHQIMVAIINGHNVYLFEEFTWAFRFLDWAIAESCIVLTVNTCTIHSIKSSLDGHGQAHFSDEFTFFLAFKRINYALKCWVRVCEAAF